MFVGINSNVATNTSGRLISVDSGASEWHAVPHVAWLPSGLNLITTIGELVEPFPPTLPKSTIQTGPDTKKHLANPSTIEARRSYTRRRG